MSIKEIEARIIKEAEAEAQKIKIDAEAIVKQLSQSQQAKIEELEAQAEAESKKKTEETERALLVPARLKAKNDLLEAKQNILGQIYDEIQKERKLSRAERDRLREETEIKAAELLFGETNK